MKANSLLKIFLPQDKIFYQLFEEVANILVKMGELLKEAVATPSQERRNAIVKEIHHLEHVNDDLTHKIFIELGQNFITPFDREDIHYLASVLDDVADYIHGSSKRLTMYRIQQPDSSIQQLSEVILSAVLELKKGIHELRDMKNLRNITDACVRINSLENKADDIYDAAITAMFNNGTDPLTVIKMREIYQTMETATDKCEDAANVLETIIVKYA